MAKKSSGARAFLLITLLLGLISCRTDLPIEGRLNISISASAAKTILPVLAPVSYRLIFSGPATVEPMTISGPSASLGLPAGTWSLRVQGLDSGDLLIARGEASGVLISPGATTSLSISIYAIADDGSGFIDLSLSWPASLSPPVSGASVELDGTSVDASDFSFSPPQLRYAEALPSGSHRLLITLQSGGASLYLWESVQVYDNLTSSGAIELSAEDFTAPPAAPADLAATAIAGGIALSWTDNSAVEEGFTIQRGFDGIDFITIDDDLGPNATSFTDNTALSGQTYHYRVFATNARGASPYSNTASAFWLAPGELGLTIAVFSPEDQAISFSHADYFVAEQTARITISISGSFDSYLWALDADLVAGATESSLEIDCAELKPGVHRLTVFVSSGGKLYSKTLSFRVYN